ncbi:MAG: glycoside hydrolase [Bacteroidales bacterium]|nr:glycoside hydrolase [Bacteroidales bacterium]
MKNFIISFCLFVFVSFSAFAQNAKWITAPDAGVNSPNTWIAFRKDINVASIPRLAMARIVADSKYWLWINGRLVVFEGGLKRGPSPQSSYYDEINIASFLKKGTNKIAILLWYFGKDGFSHKSSGKAGLFFDLNIKHLLLQSNNSWLCRIHPAYKNTEAPFPNFRLPESNIRYDANMNIDGWQTADCKSAHQFAPAVEIGTWGDTPWGEMVKRPIPLWKDYGIKEAQMKRISGADVDSVLVSLPYNMQMTPILDLTDEKGNGKVAIYTDHTFAGGDTNVRAEYIARKGHQIYESLGWMNGQIIILVVPKSVRINTVKYRETGYDTYPEGTFSCDNDFFSRFWKKGLRTLYVNMRDTYFDCPDRERAQWWGDEVVLQGECFYTYSASAHELMKKGIKELCHWQKPDGTLFAPIPAGNYSSELPGQMLAAIGKYGFWNYYMNTADRATIAEAYPHVKRYLDLWKTDDTGLTAFRAGGWTWGDWGDQKDMRLLFAGWHYLALEGAVGMAHLLGYDEDAARFEATMARVKDGYNKCWNGYAYRHPEYQGETDDRVQALAVITGIASPDKYDKILQVFKSQWHASPYMEKYVMEALFQMGYGDYALERAQKRYGPMVNDSVHTTLFEGWDINNNAFGGGTTNHAWSGGPLTVIAQYLCGIRPLEAGYKTFAINPQSATFHQASITVPTVAGIIGSSWKISNGIVDWTISVPKGTKAYVTLPATDMSRVTVNGKPMKQTITTQIEGKSVALFCAGKYHIVCKTN